MLQFLKTKTFRGVAIAALLIAVYAVAGFLVAPKLVRSALLKDIPETLGLTPAVGAIHVNPFLFQITVEDFSLAGGGEKLLGFRRLFVDFQLSSLWHRAYTFVDIDLGTPYVSTVVARDGTLNLLQLKPKAAPNPKPAAKDAQLPAIRIGSFKVSRGLVTYEDRSRPDVFAARLEPINFELRDFTTGVEGGKFTFTGVSKLGERVEWHGHLSVDPIESDGEFQVNGLLAHTVWEYLQDQVNFVLDSGTIDLAATYKFSLTAPAAQSGDTEGGRPNLRVDLSKASLSDLAVRLKTAETEAPASPWITLPQLTVSGTTVDLAKRQAHVDSVAVTGLKLVTWREADGNINLLRLAAAPSTAPTAPAATGVPATPTVAAASSSAAVPAATSAPWAYEVGQIDIREAGISAEDRTLHPAVKVGLAPLSLQLSGVSQDLTKPVNVTLDTRINEKGSLNVGGAMTLRPLTANLSLKLADVDLTALQPYIAQHTAMTLLEGTLGADAKVRYGAEKKLPALQFTGNISIDKLHTVDNALHDDFIDWDRLDILGLSYTQTPDRLDIDQIVARKLYARVIIESDSSLNVKRVLAMQDAAPGPGPDPTAATAAAASPAASSAATARAAAAVPAKSGNSSMPMSIKKIVVQGSQANFTDLSVAPNFSAGIQGLEGTVVGLSSKPGSRAKVVLHGAVDTYSPVSITGDVNVLGPLYTDLSMDFRNIALAVFNPYSGKFAGYNITKGKLSTELHYKVDGRKLDAQHHIVVEQLEFGDKTASKDAVSLPIKLAVALLKDRNGVIDLNVPVTGSLDDPQFRLAPIIWKVFVNILERAVTAPFALLGSLFGGGPDIQFIDFQPGVGTLDAPAADKLKAVTKALVERPQLNIDVPIGVVADVDRPALSAAQLNTKLSAAQAVLAAKGSAKKAVIGAPAPGFDQLDPATQLELLTQVYAKDFGTDPKFPESVSGQKAKPDIVSAKIAFLGDAIRGHIVIGDGELERLGQQRAKSLQQALLSDPQVDAERVFLVANDKAIAKDGVVRLELSLK